MTRDEELSCLAATIRLRRAYLRSLGQDSLASRLEKLALDVDGGDLSGLLTAIVTNAEELRNDAHGIASRLANAFPDEYRSFVG